MRKESEENRPGPEFYLVFLNIYILKSYNLKKNNGFKDLNGI